MPPSIDLSEIATEADHPLFRSQTLKTTNRALESQIQNSSASHNLVSTSASLVLDLIEQTLWRSQDLEAAARASTELSERVEILQQALNDQDREQGARAAAGADEGDNVWSAIVDSQSEVSRPFSSSPRRGVQGLRVSSDTFFDSVYSSSLSTATLSLHSHPLYRAYAARSSSRTRQHSHAAIRDVPAALIAGSRVDRGPAQAVVRPFPSAIFFRLPTTWHRRCGS